MKNKSIILLSGGLDSVVSLALIKEFCSEILALTFNYGQKSFEAEKHASQCIAEHYGIQHRVVDLPWLADISTSSLTNSENVPRLTMQDLENIQYTKETCKSVWVPNRNGLFLNIAASFAEALDFDSIIIGANSEEANTFKDNSIEFIKAVNYSIDNSLNKVVRVIAPLVDSSKDEIVELGIDLDIPFDLIHSCYVENLKHCGECESCLRLRRALEKNKAEKIIDTLF